MRTSLKKNIKNGINLSVSLKKDGVRVEWNSNGDCFEHREGELSKIDELPEWAVSEFKDPISEYKEKWKDQNDDLSGRYNEPSAGSRLRLVLTIP